MLLCVPVKGGFHGVFHACGTLDVSRHGRMSRRGGAGRKADSEYKYVFIALGVDRVDGGSAAIAADKNHRIGVDRTNLADKFNHSRREFFVGGLNSAVVVAAQRNEHQIRLVRGKVIGIFVAHRPVVGEEIIVGVIALVCLGGFEQADAAFGGHAEVCSEEVCHAGGIAKRCVLGFGIPRQICADGQVSEGCGVAVADYFNVADVVFGRSKEIAVAGKGV